MGLFYGQIMSDLTLIYIAIILAVVIVSFSLLRVKAYSKASRRLTLSGWVYFEDCMMYQVLISKSEYHKIKADEKIKRQQYKRDLEHLRNR